MSSDRPSRVPEFGRPDAQEFAIGSKTHRVADVEPLDVSGVRTMIFGTALWGIAAVCMLPFWSTLRDTGRTWWLWTAFAGFGLGLLGLEYCRSRLHALQSAQPSLPSSAPVAKRGFRLPSRNSATKRLMEVSKAQARATDEQTPEKSSLARKHGLLSQTTSEIPHIPDAELLDSPAVPMTSQSATSKRVESRTVRKAPQSLAERIAAESQTQANAAETPAELMSSKPLGSEPTDRSVGRRRRPDSSDD